MPDEQESPRSLVHPLDPDFLIFALPVALLIDILSFIPVLGTIVSFVLGGPLVLWMIKKGGQAPGAKKAATKRALRRGIVVFVAELITFVNFLPLWTFTVLMMLRQKSEQEPASKQPALSPA
jgi:uncharacterized Tic20 family protein